MFKANCLGKKFTTLYFPQKPLHTSSQVMNMQYINQGFCMALFSLFCNGSSKDSFKTK